MQKLIKKILCSLLVVVMCLTSAPLQGFVELDLPEINFGEWFAAEVWASDDIPTTGQCGDNAYWSFDASTGTLTISGAGAAWTGAQVEDYNLAHYVDNIIKLVIEEGIIELGTVQYRYPNLSEISFPESLEIFYPGTFDGSAYYNDESNWENDGLYIGDCFIQSREGAEGTLIVKEGTTRMSAFAISDSNYTDVVLPESMKVIPTGAFAYQTQLENVHLGKNIEKIGDAAFAVCRSLEKISGSESIKEIGIDAFGLCYKLKSINLSDTEKIGDMAFSLCLTLDEVDLSSAKEIGEQAFMMCTSLKDVTLPSSLKSIGKEAFLGASFSEAYIYNPEMQFGESSIYPAVISDDFKKELVDIHIEYYDLLFSGETDISNEVKKNREF